MDQSKKICKKSTSSLACRAEDPRRFNKMGPRCLESLNKIQYSSPDEPEFVLAEKVPGKF